LDEIEIAVVLIVWLLLVLLILTLLLRHSNKKIMKKIAEFNKRIESVEELATDNNKKIIEKQELLKRFRLLEKELKKRALLKVNNY
jgi:uncharacterized membrane protein